jgi:hypothetical protein
MGNIHFFNKHWCENSWVKICEISTPMSGHITDFAENFLYNTYIGTNQHQKLLGLEKIFSSQNGASKFGAKFEKPMWSFGFLQITYEQLVIEQF